MPKVVDHERRREDIAEATWRVVASRGLDAATVREIASETGCSTGVLAHYFRDKDELLLYALRLAWDRAARRMEDRSRNRPAREALRSVLLEALPLDDDGRAEWRVWLSFWGRAASDASLAAEQKARYALWRRLVQRLILACQREGSVGPDVDVQEATESIVALVDGIGIQATLEPDHLRPERQIALVHGYLSRLAR